MSDFYCSNTSEMVCPYCGYEHIYDGADGPFEGKEECQKCGKYFQCTPEYEVTFTTEKRDCWNGIEHNFRKNKFWTKNKPDEKEPYNCSECGETKWI